MESHIFVSLHDLIATMSKEAAGQEPCLALIKVPSLWVDTALQDFFRLSLGPLLSGPPDWVDLNAAQLDIQGRIAGPLLEMMISGKGRGIHLGRLKIRAASLDVPYESAEDLLDHFFQSSVKVGNHLEILGGTMRIILLDTPKLLHDYVPFAFRITLPLDRFIQPS